MPGVVGLAVAAAWTLIVLAWRRPWRTTCAALRLIATTIPGGRWALAALLAWLPVHVCRPLFPRRTR